MAERELVERELSEVDEELEFLFKRFEELLDKRKRLVKQLKEHHGERKTGLGYIRHRKVEE